MQSRGSRRHPAGPNLRLAQNRGILREVLRHVSRDYPVHHRRQHADVTPGETPRQRGMCQQESFSREKLHHRGSFIELHGEKRPFESEAVSRGMDEVGEDIRGEGGNTSREDILLEGSEEGSHLIGLLGDGT